jgi:predicted PurR-regulated permease PerM
MENGAEGLPATVCSIRHLPSSLLAPTAMSFPPPTHGQARVIWFAVSALAVGLLVALLCMLVWGLGQVLNVLSPVLWPLAVAGVIAYLLDPVVDFLERKGSPRTRAILVVFALAFFIVVGLLGSIVPQAVVETQQLVRQLPAYAVKLEKKVQAWAGDTNAPVRRFLQRDLPTLSHTNTAVTTEIEGALATTNVAGLSPSPADSRSLFGQSIDSDTIRSATTWLAQALPKVGSWLFGQVIKVASWFGVLAGLALVPVYVFYFLLEKKGIESKWTDYLPVTQSGFKDELVFVLSSINEYLVAFFRGQVLVAICDGVLYTIGFICIGLPYAVLLGVMATFLTMIPFVGAIFTCLAALVIALVQYGDWLHPLLVLGVIAVVQALEGLVISPKIMGDRVGLHPLSIIIAVMVGTTLLGGILGGILAIPLAAALRVLMFRYIWKTPDQKGAPQPKG